MKTPFAIGDQKKYWHTVSDQDLARFASGTVHAVYSTFAIARDAEWSGRLFVLEMKEESEEGIGTGINIIHHAPALLGQAICFTATLTAIERNEVHTQFEAHEGARLIASGTQTQKIINKEKLKRLFQAIANGA